VIKGQRLRAIRGTMARPAGASGCAAAPKDSIDDAGDHGGLPPIRRERRGLVGQYLTAPGCQRWAVNAVGRNRAEPSLTAQRDDRIDRCRAPRRQVRGEQRGDCQHEAGAGQRRGIGGRDAKEKRAQ
jgi:hypothetical protein